MWFRIVGEISNIEPIAAGRSVREQTRLRRNYAGKRWRKLKRFAIVELPNGRTARAEVRWYEAHGVGRREMKLKRLLD